MISNTSLSRLKDMINSMPNGPGKRKMQEKHTELISKIQERQQIAADKSQNGKGAKGLNDTFKFNPSGHITIETIDNSGQVIDTLVDKENLVVHGADEIALRALSGDPTRILYKNRKILFGGVATGSINKSELHGRPLVDAGRLMHPANKIWNSVNEEDFQASHSFVPTYLFIKEVPSTDPTKVNFEISEAAGGAPLQSEIYSTHSNLFIGLGNGKDRLIAPTEKVVSLTNPAAFDLTGGKFVTAGVNEAVTLKGKISRARIVIERSPLGGKIDVEVNGALKETIVTFKSDGVDEIEYEFTALNLDNESTVVLTHRGGTESAAPAMTIKAIYADILTKDMNSLFSEFKSFETDFTTPTSYNTRPDAPYTVQLPYAPIEANSVTVSYQGKAFEEVADKSLLTPDTFHVDLLNGQVTFERALTGVYIGFMLEEAIRYEEAVNATNTKLTAATTTVTESVQKTESSKSLGTGDGTTVLYDLGRKNVNTSSIILVVNGVNYLDFTSSINSVTGNDEITLDVAPAVGDTVWTNFVYMENVTTNKAYYEYKPSETITAINALVDQNGTPLTKVTGIPLGNGEYQEIAGSIALSEKAADGTPLTDFTIAFASVDFKGKPTNYNRAVIDKPKSENLYPWFELDKGKIQFVAEFPEEAMLQNMTIREMILANGPRVDDQIEGFDNQDVKAFSIVRVPETIKNVNTGIRITWTITLKNEDNLPFLGGNN